MLVVINNEFLFSNINQYFQLLSLNYSQWCLSLSWWWLEGHIKSKELNLEKILFTEDNEYKKKFLSCINL